MSENKSNWDNEKIGSLWKKTSAKGTSYLSGTVNGVKVMVFKTKEKRNDNSPDYIVYESTQGGATKSSTAPTVSAGKPKTAVVAPQSRVKSNPAPQPKFTASEVNEEVSVDEETF